MYYYILLYIIIYYYKLLYIILNIYYYKYYYILLHIIIYYYILLYIIIYYYKYYIYILYDMFFSLLPEASNRQEHPVNCPATCHCRAAIHRAAVELALTPGVT